MICIVGALAVDLLVSRERFVKGTSNPSSIRLAPGGVGYRIYSHLQSPKMLFTALGSDVFGKWLIENIGQPQWVNPIFLDQYSTSCYCALMQSGELFYGAADMAVIEEGLSWPRLRARLPELGEKDFLVLEANLSPDLVRSLLHQFGRKTRVVFESVSVEKLLRHADVLKNLYLIAGNEEEFKALGKIFTTEGNDNKIDVPARPGFQSDCWVQAFLEERKIEQLLVTRGRRGVRLYQRDPRTTAGRGKSQGPLIISPNRVIETVDTTGAGDRLLSVFLETADREAAAGDVLKQAVESVERAIEEGNL
ncbi:Pseudouridine kinase [subsurface metagenome]